VKYGLLLPALILLPVALAAGGSAWVVAAALAFYLAGVGILALDCRHDWRISGAALSIGPAALAVTMLLLGPGTIFPGLFAALFFLGGVAAGTVCVLAMRQRPRWFVVPLLLIVALGSGELAQPSPWWDARHEGLIPWAPSLRWDIDRITNFLGNKTNLTAEFIGNESVTKEKPSGQKRVFITGSSVVIGAGLPGESDAFPAVAEKTLADDAIRFYNAGIYGGDVAIWVYYRDILSRLEHDVVVYYTGAIGDAAGVPVKVWRKLEALVGNLPSDESRRRLAVEACTSNLWLARLKLAWFATSTGRNWRRLRSEALYEPRIEPELAGLNEAMTEQMSSLLDSWIIRTRNTGVELVLAPGTKADGSFTAVPTAMLFRRAAADHGHVHFWDTRPVLAGGRFFDVTHPTVEGHAALGRALAKFLKRTVLTDVSGI